MLAYVIYRKSLLLLVAYYGVKVATSIMPAPSSWSISQLMGEFIFSPIKLLMAVIMFIIGFLSYSLFVQDALRFAYAIERDWFGLLFVILAGFSWIHLLMTGGFMACLALSLAIIYGIMDVNLGNRKEKN